MTINGIIQFDSALVLDKRARSWCRLPYASHKHGCPKFGKCALCPPKVCLFKDFIDTTKPMWLYYIEFDLAAHMAAKKQKHPKWTERQCRNLLYWQPTVNKELRMLVENACPENLARTFCPEAMGVNVIKTARNAGLNVSYRPRTLVYKIAIAGYPANS